MNVLVVEYRAGNWRSVVNACNRLGRDAVASSDPARIAEAERIIVPGVGSFGAAVESLHDLNLWNPLCAAIESGRPFLGICLGLQLLFRGSEESRGVEGLGRFDARSTRIAGEKVPQLGWNEIAFDPGEPLFAGVEPRARVYYANSYAVGATGADFEVATTDYGGPMVAAVREENVYGVQFHPEKSGNVGLAILKNFLEGS